MEDLADLAELYLKLKPVLQAMNLTHEGIRYYAGSVIKSQIFQLNQRSDEDRYVHVIAFIAHQYYRLHDNLIDVFLKVVQSLQNTSQREHKEQIYCERKVCNANLTNLLSRLDDDVFAVMRKIRELAHDAYLSDTDKICNIRSLLKTGKDDQLSGLKAGLEGELSEGGYFKVLESRSLRLQTRVSPILKALCFQAEPGAITLMKAIEHFKEKDGAVSSSAPLDFLEPQEREAVIGAEGERFRTSLFKVFFCSYTRQTL